MAWKHPSVSWEARIPNDIPSPETFQDDITVPSSRMLNTAVRPSLLTIQVVRIGAPGVSDMQLNPPSLYTVSVRPASHLQNTYTKFPLGNAS